MDESTRVCSCCSQALSCMDTPPQKSLCMSLMGLTASGCSPTWARLQLGHLHPISLLLWECRCGGAPLQPMGQAGLLLCTASAFSYHACWVMLGVLKHHIPKHPALGRTGPGAAPSSSISACLSPPWSQLSCVQAHSPWVPGSHGVNERLWLKPGERCNKGQASAVGLWPSGAWPSALLCPLPCGALLRSDRLCQEEVGADGFPQAQADGRVLLWWGRGLREQEGAA